MPTMPLVVLEIDDNTPPDLPPFTHDVSVWSFADDLNVSTRTGTDTFRAVHAALDGSRFRGYPERAARTTVELLDSLVDSGVTWLTGTELATAGPLLPAGNEPVERSLRLLFQTVELAGRHFGPDRVRLVFGFY